MRLTLKGFTHEPLPALVKLKKRHPVIKRMSFYSYFDCFTQFFAIFLAILLCFIY